MRTYSGVWIRTAGNVQQIRANGSHQWRCFVNCEGPEIPLRLWRVTGQATFANFRVDTDPTAGNALGLSAWIDCYGDLVIDDEDTAVITLQPTT